MAAYTCLKQQQFRLGAWRLVPLRYGDRFDIMRWRNEQIYHLRQDRLLTEEDQQRYFDEVVSKLYGQPRPDQVLFSYLEGDVCIGYGGLVHINWKDRHAEISFLMDTRLEKDGFADHWTRYLTMLREVAFGELGLHKIYTYAFDLRPHLYKVLEDNGFTREATLRDHCLFEGAYKDVVIHSLFNDHV
jgi:RimJ/RimL family protein N-acetyltransferase